MARFRIRIRFNPGRVGAPMDKLGAFSSQAERFLRALAHDLGLPARKGEWLAVNFSNESVGFDAEYAEGLLEPEAERGTHAIDLVTGPDPLAACNRGFIGYGTLAEFARLSTAMDPDEKFLIGLYKNGEEKPAEWRDIPYRRISEIRQLLEAPMVSQGAVQGVIHAWHYGSKPPFFHLRDLASGNLIRCNYEPKLHARIHEASDNPQTVVIVYGEIEWDRATNLIVQVSANDVEITRSLTEFEFDALFGSAPEFTGDMSTADYIEWIRGDGD